MWGGFAPHNGPEEQCFGKGYSNALATSRETSRALALKIPLLCLLDPFLHAKQVTDSGLSCLLFFLTSLMRNKWCKPEQPS